MGDLLSILFVILAILLMVPDNKKKKQQQNKRQEGRKFPPQGYDTSEQSEKEKRMGREKRYPDWLGQGKSEDEQPVPCDEEYWPEEDYHGSIGNSTHTPSGQYAKDRRSGNGTYVPDDFQNHKNDRIYKSDDNSNESVACSELRTHNSANTADSEKNANIIFDSGKQQYSDVNYHKRNALTILAREVGTRDPLAYAMLMSEILQPPLSRRERKNL